MPRWSVWFLRAAFLWLILGSTVGALLLSARGFAWSLPWAPLLGLHLELVLAGWMLQFTLGTAFWMLPRHASGPERGPEYPVATAFVLLNLGMLLAAGGGVLGAGPEVLASGRLAEFAAVVAFARNAWPRIKPFGAGRARVLGTPADSADPPPRSRVQPDQNGL